MRKGTMRKQHIVKMNLPKKKIHWAMALSSGACLVTELGTKTIEKPFCVRNKEVPFVQGQRLKKGLLLAR